MDFLDMLFKIVEHFGLITSEKEFDSMKEDMKEWRRENIKEDSKNAIYRWYAIHGRAWYMKLALAIAFIPITKWVYGILHPDKQNQGE